jgi:hypothetical protein
VVVTDGLGGDWRWIVTYAQNLRKRVVLFSGDVRALVAARDLGVPTVEKPGSTGELLAALGAPVEAVR